MAPSAKVKAAFQAMRDIGISETKTKPVLKKLYKLFDKNWDAIEQENYRVLADAIFEYEENEVFFSLCPLSIVPSQLLCFFIFNIE